jgi:hypothetical protein
MYMRIYKIMPVIFFILGVASAIIAYILSLKWGTGFQGGTIDDPNENLVGGGIDLAADGGALGFALLGGICFFCCAYLLKDKKQAS